MTAAALAALPLQTPGRLRRLVSAGEPAETFRRIIEGERVIAGVDERVWRAWRSCSGLDETVEQRCGDLGITVTHLGGPGYPDILLDDRRAPAVLFHSGDTGALRQRRVGVIGTRTASLFGASFARKIGRELSMNGVSVVSGLARGIDINAHRGVLEAPGGRPVAVVACGLDVVYPPEHDREWRDIAERGIIISESPPGTAPETHRFPLRNRILAALSEVVVVVESRRTGGSMITVSEAEKRGIPVLAVPGSPNQPVSDGTNALIADGCHTARDTEDIMVALGLVSGGLVRSVDTRPAPGPAEARLLACFAGEPRTTDELVVAAALDVFEVGLLLGRLESKGWVEQANGWWEALT